TFTLAGLSLSVPALAHAYLKSASPAVGSTVAAPPSEITLRFSEKVERAFSTIEVTGPGGARADAGDLHLDAAEPTGLHASLKGLGPGMYKVVWRVVSVDTHVTNGNFTFRVAAQATSKTTP